MRAGTVRCRSTSTHMNQVFLGQTTAGSSGLGAHAHCSLPLPRTLEPRPHPFAPSTGRRLFARLFSCGLSGHVRARCGSAHSSTCPGSAQRACTRAALQERQRPEKGPSLAISCRTARQGLSTRGVASRRSPLHVELGLECFQMVS